MNLGHFYEESGHFSLNFEKSRAVGENSLPPPPPPPLVYASAVGLLIKKSEIATFFKIIQ